MNDNKIILREAGDAFFLLAWLLSDQFRTYPYHLFFGLTPVMAWQPYCMMSHSTLDVHNMNLCCRNLNLVHHEPML